MPVEAWQVLDLVQLGDDAGLAEIGVAVAAPAADAPGARLTKKARRVGRSTTVPGRSVRETSDVAKELPPEQLEAGPELREAPKLTPNRGHVGRGHAPHQAAAIPAGFR